MFKRFWWVFLVMFPVGAVAGLLVAAVITYVMPKKYESEATIEVKPIGGQSGSPMTPQFFGTEFEKITSSNSLGKVVDHLELINKWSVDKETAIRILKGVVTTENIRGTDLISIRVRHTNKEDARDITAEVAKAYRDYRIEILKRGDGERLLELKKAVFDQEDKVEERRRILATIMKLRNNTDDVGTVDITNDGANSNEESPEPDKAENSAKRREGDAPTIADAKRELETEQKLLWSMKLKLTNDSISAKTQDETIVIHEEPQIAQAPVSPNVTLNLVLGTGLGLLLSPLLALPLIWLLNRLMPVKVTA